jgi:ribosomal protein S12 methylthiotransferase accessory factor
VTEPNNFVEHFIDSSGVVSWRFFSAKADFEFVEWDFSGHGENSNRRRPRRCSASSRTWARKCTWRCTTTRRHRLPHPGAGLLGGLSGRGPDLGQHQQGAAFPRRHPQPAPPRRAAAEALLNAWKSELDDYTDITTLIGIEFDENTVWGQLTILELKLLINLALQQFEEAKELVEAFLQYNDNTVERGLFYQALNVVLEWCWTTSWSWTTTKPTSAACSATRAWTR